VSSLVHVKGCLRKQWKPCRATPRDNDRIGSVLRNVPRHNFIVCVKRP
jgi:hypothetical protein